MPADASLSLTPSTQELELRGGTGRVTFTLTNTSARALKLVVEPIARGSTRAEWLALDGPARVELAPGASHQFALTITAPHDLAAGRYPVAARAGEDDALPDERVESAVVAIAAPAAPPARRPWLPIAIGAAVVIAIGVGTAVVWPRGSSTPDAGVTPKPKEIAFDALCGELSRGGSLGFARGEASCGEPLRPEDAVHLSIIEVAMPHEPTGKALEPFLTCDPAVDGGLGQQVARWASSIDAGRMSYHGDLAYQCRAIGRQRHLSMFVLDEKFAPCDGIVRGEVGEGGACASHDECAPTHFCRADSPGSCGGKCARRLGLGVSCVPRRDACVENAGCVAAPGGGFRCDWQRVPGARCTTDLECRFGVDRCVNGVCVEKGGSGEPCSDLKASGDCKPGFTCRAQPGGQATCTRSAALGEACSLDGVAAVRCGTCTFCDSQSHTCKAVTDSSLECDAATGCPKHYACISGKCAFKARAGEPCSLTPGAPAFNRGNCLYADNYCRTAGGATAGTCAPLPGRGEPCIASQCAKPFLCDGATCVDAPRAGQPCLNNQCADGATCAFATRTCVALPQAGAPCSIGQCAPGNICISGTCRDALATGAACTNNAECATGHCDAVAHVCAQSCVAPASPAAGCTKTTNFMLFAMVLGFVGVRRRRWLP